MPKKKNSTKELLLNNDKKYIDEKLKRLEIIMNGLVSLFSNIILLNLKQTKINYEKTELTGCPIKITFLNL